MSQEELNVADRAAGEVVGEHHGGSALDRILKTLDSVERRLTSLEELLAEVSRAVAGSQSEKEWYTTAELADLLIKSDFTVREKWCNQRRIECEKDPDSGKWRIPAHEVSRLRNGGGLRPRQPR